MQKDKEKIFYQILLAVAAILLVFLIYRLNEATSSAPIKSDISQNKILQVNAQPIIGQDKIISKKYVGYVTPINEVAIIPYISGFIEEINVQSGQEVNIAQPLLRIKPEEYLAKKEAAAAALLKAEAALANAKIYFERMEKAGEKALSKTEIDNARAAYLEAQAAYAGAKADLQSAEVNLGYTNINSSISGTVGYINLSVGDYISPNKQLFNIIQFDPIRVVFSISDNDYLQEKNKDKLFAEDVIKLELANGEIYESNGHFAFSDNQINPTTNSLAVYADYENPNKVLVANSYVDVIVEKTLKNTISIEKKLLIMKPEGNFVFVIRNGVAALHKVEIAADDGSYYIVYNDFSPQDMLITDVNNNITEGLPVAPHIQTAVAIKEEK